jgi:hypothetical protein
MKNFCVEFQTIHFCLVITPSSSTEFLGRPAWFTERLRLLWDFYPTPEKFEPVNYFHFF